MAIAQAAHRARGLGADSGTGAPAPAAGSADDPPDLAHLLAAYGKGTLERVRSYAVVLLQSDHGFTFEQVHTAPGDKTVCRISAIDASVVARALTIGAPGQAARTGDYVIDVISRRRSGDDRSLPTTVLLGEGRKKAQYPVTLIVLAHESTLFSGLPPPPVPKLEVEALGVGALGAGVPRETPSPTRQGGAPPPPQRPRVRAPVGALRSGPRTRQPTASLGRAPGRAGGCTSQGRW